MRKEEEMKTKTATTTKKLNLLPKLRGFCSSQPSASNQTVLQPQWSSKCFDLPNSSQALRMLFLWATVLFPPFCCTMSSFPSFGTPLKPYLLKESLPGHPTKLFSMLASFGSLYYIHSIGLYFVCYFTWVLYVSPIGCNSTCIKTASLVYHSISV